jgi:prevent-host-death family protein
MSVMAMRQILQEIVGSGGMPDPTIVLIAPEVPGCATMRERCRLAPPAARANLVSMTSLAKPTPQNRRQRSSRARASTGWQLQEAKARFSELVRRARQEGPQVVTVHGRDEVVVIGADDYRKLAGERTGHALVEAMEQSPHRSTSIAPRRQRLPVRDVDL